MSRTAIGRWGRSLAVPVPLEIARQAGLREGERVEIEARNGEIVIRRLPAGARRAALQAADEIIEESRRYRLDRKAARDLVNEGRRGSA